MSRHRFLTDVPEIGWEDMLSLAEVNPEVRVEGRVRDGLGTTRFNRAVTILPHTASVERGQPRVESVLLHPDNDGVRHPFPLKWGSVDYVSWVARGNPANQRLKVTHTGSTRFGRWTVHECVVLDACTREVGYVAHNRGLAVMWALRNSRN